MGTRAAAMAIAMIAVAAVAWPASAAPPELAGAETGVEDDRAGWVIPPGREQPARDLVAPVLDSTPASWSWRGPAIEIDTVKWWLMQGEQARAMIVLGPPDAVPEAAEPPTRSESFTIAVAWNPDIEPEPTERELAERFVASIVERDAGGFYIPRFESEVVDEDEEPEVVLAPGEVRLRWWLKIAGVAALCSFALVVTLRRPRPADVSRTS